MNNHYPSRYNFLWKMNSKYFVIYNSKAGSLAVFEIDKFQDIKDVFNRKNISNVELKNFLISEKFLIDKKIDEINQLRKDFFNAKFNRDNLNFILHPTSECNFNCKYCFESKKIRQNNSKMTREVQNCIISVFEKKKKETKKLNILWFGGEPLLAIEVIKRLSNKFIKICKENNIEYNAKMVTNGYLLCEKNVEFLIKYKINRVQITIDGLRETHNKRRPLRSSKKGSYDVIMQNLFYAVKKLEKIIIRINIDKKNQNEIEPLINEIKKIKDKNNVIISLAKIYANEEANNKYLPNCISCKSFINYELKFINKLKKYGIQYFHYPLRISHICAADQINSYVISSDGKIYKCFNDIENEKLSIGDFKNFDTIQNNLTYKKYMNFDPTKDKICKNCKLLPLCMGGCLRSRLFNNKKECSIFKGNLKKVIFHYVKNEFLEKVIF